MPPLWICACHFWLARGHRTPTYLLVLVLVLVPDEKEDVLDEDKDDEMEGLVVTFFACSWGGLATGSGKLTGLSIAAAHSSNFFAASSSLS